VTEGIKQLSVKLTLFAQKSNWFLLKAQCNAPHEISSGLRIEKYFLGDISATVCIHKGIAIG
jgi:hypothetical protein